MNNTAAPDDLAPNMVAKALNCQLTNITGGKASVAWRPAFFGLLSSALSGNPRIISMYPYEIGGYEYILLLGNNGSLYTYKLEERTATAYASAITVYTNPQSWVTAKDVAWLVNGTDQISFNGSTVAGFGITRPTVGTLAGAAGAAGNHNGTYELRVTFGISSLDVESSASDSAASTVVVASQAISWTNIPVSADSRVDRRYLHIRNTSTMTNFYRAGTITNNTDTTATTDILDTALTIIAPSTTSNEPPPSGAKYLAWHKNRVFVATDTLVYWGNLGKPTEFNTLYNKVNPNPSDGQKITGLAVFHDMLIVFKERSMYGIVGDDPNSWIIKQLYPAVGCHSSASILSVEDKLFWWSREGPMVWGGASQPMNIGTQFINETLNLINDKSYASLHSIIAGLDIDGQRILWSTPITTDIGGADSTNLRMYLLPFNYRVGRWESDGWTATNVLSMAAAAENTYGNMRLYLGNDQGFLFKLSDLHYKDSWLTSDGLIAGDTSYSTSTTSWASIASKTFTIATTTTNAVKGRSMALWTSAGIYKGDRRILSNTTTVATVDATFDYTDETLPGVYTYYIAGHDMVLDLPWWDFGAPFVKKRLEYVYLLADLTTVTYPITVQVFVDDTESTVASSIATNLYVSTGIEVPKKLRIDLTGRSFKVRIIDPKAANDRMILRQVTLRAEILTDNLN